MAASPDRRGTALSSLHPSRSAAQAAHTQALPALRSAAPPRRPRSLQRVLSTRSADRRRLGPRRPRSAREAMPGMVRSVHRLAARALSTSGLPAAPAPRRAGAARRDRATLSADRRGLGWWPFWAQPGRRGQNCWKRFSLTEASCSPATSAVASLTADALDGSSAARSRCAPRPSAMRRGCWPVASAPGGSASDRSKITRSSSASRSLPSSPRTSSAPACATGRRARAPTSRRSSPPDAITGSGSQRCATSSTSPARSGSASPTRPPVSRTGPLAAFAAAP